MSPHSREVKIENGTRNSTLRFFHRTGLLSSQREVLKTLSPPSGDDMTVGSSSFVFQFERGTNEFIEVEYKVEMENQEQVENLRRRTGVSNTGFESAGVRIDSTTMWDNSRISVVDSEAAAQGSSRKKFELRTEPRGVQYEAGWLQTFVVILYTGLKYAIISSTHVFKYVCSAFRNLISKLVTHPPAEPPANAAEPPANDAEPPANAAEPPANVAEPPANAAEPPANAAEPPAIAAEPPANAAEPPVNAAEPPAEAAEPSAIATEPPVNGTDASWVWVVHTSVSSVKNYVAGWEIWTYLHSANPNESTLPRYMK